MKTTRVISALAAIVIAGSLVAACDEAPKGNQSSGASNSSATTQTSTSKKDAAWPGVSSGAITVAPVLTASNFMIVYDGSGSMDERACGSKTATKHSEGLAAVKSFVDAIPVAANVGLYVFDNNSRGIRVPLGANNKSKVVAAMDAVRTGAGTPLGEAVYKSYKSLTAQGQKQLGYGRYSLVIVTDGAASDASYLSKVIDHVAAKSPVEIHTIGFCLGDKHTLNQQGKTFYASAQSKADLLSGLKGVLAEAENVTPDDFK